MHHGHHFTPAQLADKVEMSEEEVLRLCAEMSVAVLHGRIDKSLFDLARREQEQHDPGFSA